MQQAQWRMLTITVDLPSSSQPPHLGEPLFRWKLTQLSQYQKTESKYNSKSTKENKSQSKPKLPKFSEKQQKITKTTHDSFLEMCWARAIWETSSPSGKQLPRKCNKGSTARPLLGGFSLRELRSALARTFNFKINMMMIMVSR